MADVAYVTQRELEADEKDVSYEYQVHLIISCIRKIVLITTGVTAQALMPTLKARLK